jgi:mono/diheme cytochrome c family protein
MNKKIIFSVGIVCVSLLASCSYNKTELPTPEEEAVEATNPNGTVVTYTSHVKTIMDNNCIGCHGGSGGVNLDTYSVVKAQADAGRILARAINGSGGTMPPGGLMPQTTLDTLQFWLDQGALQ